MWKTNLVALALMCTTTLWIPLAIAEETPVTVSILRVIQVDDPDDLQGIDFGDGPDRVGNGDFFAEVRIGSNPPQNNRSNFIESSDFQPDWKFMNSIDDEVGTIPIIIRIWDAEGINENRDDIIDINKQDNEQQLVLNLDLSTCTWTGDAGTNGTFSQGDGDVGHTGLFDGGQEAKILFDVACSETGDIDQDGIPDGIELHGVFDGNGEQIADMAALGADPCRPTIAVEIDFMATDGHSHEPTQDGLDQVSQAFDAAADQVLELTPQECPYPGFPAQSGGGINLITVVDDSLEEEPETPLAEVPRFRRDNFNEALRPYFHYSLWVHKIGGSLEGQCCSEKDFIVGLGSKQNDVIDTIPWQSIVFMHELGHALGLSHGGGHQVDANVNAKPRIRNCKPNYLSVMNYVFAFSGLYNDDTGQQLLDYSRGRLPKLDERRLIETDGIGDGSLVTMWADPDGKMQTGRGDQRLDFDNNPATTESAVDLTAFNGISGCNQDADGNEGPSGLASPGDKLSGWNDWENIKFRGRVAPGASEGGEVFEEQVTPEEVQEIQAVWSRHLRCNPPEDGDWVIRKDCTVWRNATAPGNLVVENAATLRVPKNITLSVDFAAHSLRIEPGAKLDIQPGGRIE